MSLPPIQLWVAPDAEAAFKQKDNDVRIPLDVVKQLWTGQATPDVANPSLFALNVRAYRVTFKINWFRRAIVAMFAVPIPPPTYGRYLHRQRLFYCID
jgi:hypothetical protein